jgi:FAD/FMN-containing dehydrogenase
MEYSLPAAHMADTIHAIETCIRRERFPVHFPIECRYVRGDDIYFSPASGRDSAYIAVHMYRGMPYRAYFAAIEAIFRGFGGRPHWGKLHTLTAAELCELYPDWSRFQAARRQLDRDGVFQNAYLAQLLGDLDDAPEVRQVQQSVTDWQSGARH